MFQENVVIITSFQLKTDDFSRPLRKYHITQAQSFDQTHAIIYCLGEPRSMLKNASVPHHYGTVRPRRIYSLFKFPSLQIEAGMTNIEEQDSADKNIREHFKYSPIDSTAIRISRVFIVLVAIGGVSFRVIVAIKHLIKLITNWI